MTFALNAAGTRHDVIASLKNTPVHTQLGSEIRELIVRHLEADNTESWSGYHQAYIVEASGYGGDSSSVALNITVRSIAQAAPAEPETASEGVDAPDPAFAANPGDNLTVEETAEAL